MFFFQKKNLKFCFSTFVSTIENGEEPCIHVCFNFFFFFFVLYSVSAATNNHQRKINDISF